MYSKFIKRIFDILFCLIALPFLIIFTIIIGIAIKIEDQGPIFYKAKRIGKNSKIFNMFKFRSMNVDAPNILNKDGSTYNAKDDNRVTKVGKFIRKTSIDELPQIFNIIIGQMSWIGPRASGAEALETYKKDEIDKMKVKPGLTGYCQAYYRNSIGVREKRLKDAWYANNVTFWLDVKIFFKTIKTVLKRENIYTNTEIKQKNYLLISNGNKEEKEKYESKEKIQISSMRRPCLDAIAKYDYNIYMGINKKYASNLKADYNKEIKMYDANIYRNIYNIKDNYKAYRNLNSFLKEYKINVIHCNTPIGGFLGRICGHKNHINKIIYTAHGFHFYKGNSIIKNFIFKNVEKYLAHYTDAIITINKEDYESAKKFKLKNNGKVYLIHGVGVNINNYINIVSDRDKDKKRRELKLDNKDIILISIGDINDNKNVSLLIDIIKIINNPNIKCLICGKGPLINKMKRKAYRLGISNQILFLGYRNDIRELLSISDIYISTSKREGLPRALMEAMAAGLPCVVSKIRGNIDLIDNDKGGYCCNEIADYIYAINNIINNNKIRKKFIDYNNKKIIKYSYENVLRELTKIYEDIGL